MSAKKKVIDTAVELGIDVIKDDIKEYKKSTKETKNTVALISLITVLLFVLGVGVFAVNIFGTVTNTASQIGGSVVGVLSGAIKAPKEYSGGKAEGLSAEDTEAFLANEMSETGNLDVLVAGIKITNLHKIGEDTEYANLTVFKGYAVFTVDLSKARIDVGEKIVIILPQVEVNPTIDEKATRVIAEWQKYSFSGTTEDGYKAYLNSWNEMKKDLINSIEGYDALVQIAEDSAVSQVSTIITNATGKEAVIIFEEAE